MLALALLVPALALVALRGAPVAQAAGACASATGACIQWGASMIYAGQNNGNPEGPVGEHALVHGTKFTPGKYTLAVVKGDVNTSGQSPVEFCKLSQKVAVGGSVTAAGNGTFDAPFDWPAGASSGQWSICAYDSTTSMPPLNGNVDDGPFSVLSSHSPAVSISSASIAPGDTLTVTGHYWLPAQGGILVYVGSCADCDAQPVASTQATSGPDGSFTATLPIPSRAAAGSFVVSANAHGGVLDVGQANAKHVTIVAPKPTATTQPSPTVTAATTAVAPPPSSNSSSDNSSLIIALVIGVVVLLAALAGLLAYVLTRRKPTPDAPGYGGPGYGAPGGYDRPTGYGGGAYGSRPDYGAPYGAPTPPPNRGNLWGGDWDPESTSVFPGGGQTGQTQQARTRQADPYPDDSPTNPGNLPPDDPWGR